MMKVVLGPDAEIAMRMLDPDGAAPGASVVQLPGTLGHR